jgi:hypothetical protein
MRISRISLWLAVTVLALVWSASGAWAFGCTTVTALVKVGGSFHGATCNSYTYVAPNGQTVVSKSCACNAQRCIRLCFGPNGPYACGFYFVNAYCIPNIALGIPPRP